MPVRRIGDEVGPVAASEQSHLLGGEFIEAGEPEFGGDRVDRIGEQSRAKPIPPVALFGEVGGPSGESGGIFGLFEGGVIERDAPGAEQGPSLGGHLGGSGTIEEDRVGNGLLPEVAFGEIRKEKLGGEAILVSVVEPVVVTDDERRGPSAMAGRLLRGVEIGSPFAAQTAVGGD